MRRNKKWSRRRTKRKHAHTSRRQIKAVLRDVVLGEFRSTGVDEHAQVNVKFVWQNPSPTQEKPNGQQR